MTARFLVASIKFGEYMFTLLFVFVLSILFMNKTYAQSVRIWGSSLGPIPAYNNILDISGGSRHMIILKNSGTVEVFGSNSQGQANVPAGLTDVIAIEAGNDFNLALKANGTVAAWGRNSEHQCDVPPGLNNVIAISAGLYHSVALKSDGTVVAWGATNFPGHVAVPAGLSGVVAISAGDGHTLALKSDGTVVAWAQANAFGVLNVPVGLNDAIAIAAGFSHNLVLKSDGTVIAWGDNARGERTVPAGLTDVISISVGFRSSQALKADGTVVAWGNNGNGESTVPSNLGTAIATTGGGVFTAALTIDHEQVRLWGGNANTGDLVVPMGLPPTKNISVSNNNVLVLSANGSVAAFGDNTSGQRNVPPTLANVKAINTGLLHAQALKANGTLELWGDNSAGQLSGPISTRKTIRMAAGNSHGLALQSDGSVAAWGANDQGQSTVPPDALMRIKSIAAGGSHSIALKDDGTLVAWGNNDYGQISIPAGLTDVKMVATSEYHTVALKSDGTLVAWGKNDRGQCTIPAGLANVTEVATGSDHTIARLADGTFVIFGDNTEGEGSIPAGVTPIKRIFAGNNFNAAIVTNSAPVLSGQPVALTYVENGNPIQIHNALSVADNYDVSLQSATITITSGFTSGDILSVTVPQGITQNYDMLTGMLTINGNASLADYQTMLRSATYHSTSDLVGSNRTRSVQIKVSDGVFESNALSASINITIVNDPPVFQKGPDILLLEDATAYSALWATNISPGPPDEVSQTLTFSLTNDNNRLFSRQPSIDRLGNLTFTPAVNKSGIATVTVTLNDNGGTANGGVNRTTQTFTITIDMVNDAPAFTSGNNITSPEDVAYSAPWARNISAGPVDENSQNLVFTLTNDNAALFNAQPSIDILGNLTFTPVADKSGVATVTVTLTDDGGTANGGMDRITHTFTITIEAANDAPTFSNGNSITVLEDSPPYSALWATNISPGPSDETSQSLTFTLTNDNAALFSMQPTIDLSGNLTFTVAANKSGTAHVTVTLKDDGGTAHGGVDRTTQTFTITVNMVNDAPAFTGVNSITSLEDASYASPWATNISTGPVDENSQTLVFTLANDNTQLFSVQPSIDVSGNLTFIPAANKYGVANVTVILADDGGTANGGVDQVTQTLTITVETVNDAPTFSSGNNISLLEDAPPYATLWATNISPGPSDETSQSLTFTLTNDNTALFSIQPSMDLSGNLTFTPAANKSGIANVTVTLNDNGGTANGGVDRTTQTFTITVNMINDSPTFTSGNSITSLEDASYSSPWATNISAGPLDETSQTLSFTLTNDNTQLFSVQPSIDVSGNLAFTPSANMSGAAHVTVVLIDDGGTANGGVDRVTQTFTITVQTVNDAPTFTSGSNISLLEDGAPYAALWAADISPGPSDEISQSLTFTLTNDNTALFSVQPSIDLSGNLTFTPAANKSGIANVTVTLNDNGGTANGGVDRTTQTFTISIDMVNDAPTFSRGNSITLLEDAPPYSSPWATNISPGAEENGQSVTFIVTASNPSIFKRQPTINSSGTLSFVLAPDAYGLSIVDVSLMDEGGMINGGENHSRAEMFSIEAVPVNDAPHIDPVEDQTISISGEPFTITLTGIYAGPEPDQTVTIQAVSDDPSLVSISGLQYVPGATTATLLLSVMDGKTGVTNISIVVKDNGGIENGGIDETIATFAVTVDEPEQEMFIPNLFTPDGSGVNDVFRVRAADVAEIQFNIYDANGQEVFSTQDLTTALQTGWNGRYRGKDQPAGVYTWTLHGKYRDGSRLSYQGKQYGQVILMR